MKKQVALPKDRTLLEKKDSRWCMRCGATIPLNTSEIYEPEIVNPNAPPCYFEFCKECGKKIAMKIGYRRKTG